jgi:hypothetical protein
MIFGVQGRFWPSAQKLLHDVQEDKLQTDLSRCKTWWIWDVDTICISKTWWMQLVQVFQTGISPVWMGYSMANMRLESLKQSDSTNKKVGHRSSKIGARTS